MRRKKKKIKDVMCVHDIRKWIKEIYNGFIKTYVYEEV